MGKTKKRYMEWQDPAEYIHNNKTHRSMSEAFRDAEYASPITRFKSDAWKTAEFVVVAGVFASVIFGFMYLVGISVVKWLGF